MTYKINKSITTTASTCISLISVKPSFRCYNYEVPWNYWTYCLEIGAASSCVAGDGCVILFRFRVYWLPSCADRFCTTSYNPRRKRPVRGHTTIRPPGKNNQQKFTLYTPIYGFSKVGYWKALEVGIKRWKLKFQLESQLSTIEY